MLPYHEAAKHLNELNLAHSPLENIRRISSFAERMLEGFELSLGKSDSMMDMDSQLPLTIYCALLCRNTQLKPIVSFLSDYFEPEDDFESENRTLAALKAALEYVRADWKLDE